MKHPFIILILCFSAFNAFAQPVQKCWIYFTDKDTQHYNYQEHLSPQTIENRQRFGLPLVQFTDIPLKGKYLEGVGHEGAVVINQSKWLNAASAYLSAAQQERIKKLPYVQSVEPMHSRPVVQRYHAPEANQYGLALEQMDAPAFSADNLDADGIVIGVIDAGYLGAKSNLYLEHLFKENRILGVRDLLNPKKTDHFNSRETSSDDHGTAVLQMITGFSEKGTRYGMATKAKFYLARTDHGDKEFRAEEDYWIAAMEWMDSLGVRLINTSLGYANGFDLPDDNYKPEQMDGKTAVVTKAAQIAADEKGILLVVSAGNEGGERNWRVVSAPADAKGVLAVGAVNQYGLKTYYSSIGPEWLDYLKPNVACGVQIMAGTSFSAPVVTGFAACLMQKFPHASSKEIFSAIEKSATLFPHGNNFIGYGIPQAGNALRLLATDADIKDTPASTLKVKASESYTLNKGKDKDSGRVIAFHKSDSTTVIEQEVVSTSKGQYVVTRRKGAARTTVLSNETLLEIEWED